MTGRSYRIVAIALVAVLAVGLVLGAVALLVRGDDNGPMEVLPPGVQEREQPPGPVGDGSALSNDGTEEAAVWVYISGAVHRPEVYRMQPGDLLRDVLKAAGGATGEADLEAVNLAQRVQDGTHYHIPRVGDRPTASAGASGNSLQSISSATQQTGGKLINLNTASLELLDTLHLIGPSRARAIVEYREKYGPFKSVEEIMNVRGISTGIYESIRDQVTVSAGR